MKTRLPFATRAGRALLVASLALTTLVTSASEPSRGLPHLSLADPRGVLHRVDELGASGPVILVVTAPTAATERDQRGWDEDLAATRPPRASARIVFVEDLSQSWFPGIARDALREAFDPTRGPLVLIDEDGGARRALRVDEDATVVLVFDARGRLTASHADHPTRLDATRVWQQASANAD